MEETKLLQSTLELYYCILKFYTNTKKYARLNPCYKFLISLDELNRYTTNLCELGLLDINYYDKTVKISYKGKEFLEKFDYMIKQVGFLDAPMT